VVDGRPATRMAIVGARSHSPDTSEPTTSLAQSVGFMRGLSCLTSGPAYRLRLRVHLFPDISTPAS